MSPLTETSILIIVVTQAPRYPSCNGIVDLDSTDSTAAPKQSPPQAPAVLPLPHRLGARERFEGYQTRFYEAVAVPEGILSMVNNGEFAESILQAFSQWRLDFPAKEVEHALENPKSKILSVAEKILSRGRLTLASQYVENALAKAFGGNPNQEFFESDMYCLVFDKQSRPPPKQWFDSREEHQLYENVLPTLLGHNYSQFIIPQIEISSLVSTKTDSVESKRADFGVFHPELKNGVIVEVDGPQHTKHTESDNDRDRVLRSNGFTVIRIPTSEIQRGSGANLSSLRDTLSQRGTTYALNAEAFSAKRAKYLKSFKVSQQIQMVLLEAIHARFLDLDHVGDWRVSVDFGEEALLNDFEMNEIVNIAVSDFLEMLTHLANIYSLTISRAKPTCTVVHTQKQAQERYSIFIAFSDRFTSSSATFYVQNIFVSFHVANSSFPSLPLSINEAQPKMADLRYFLQYLFRKDSFWEGQVEGIVRTLQCKDTLLLLPTGGGKSIVYQLASFLSPGRTIAIDPIIALMEDQIYNLSSFGIDRCIAITSNMTPTDREKALQLFAQGEYIIAFISPERFQTQEFRDSLRSLTMHTPVAVIVVDEAHCVSEWGHDFRTAYLNIGRTSRSYCESDKTTPPLIGLTGTASRAVLKDVQRELQINDFDAIITPKPFDRSELKFKVILTSSGEKSARLRGYLENSLPRLFNSTAANFYSSKGGDTHSGLIFCPHVNGEFGVFQLSDKIEAELGINNAPYSGSSPHNWRKGNFTEYKQRIAREFKRNSIPLLVCTSAFGMGIDKPNIRYTIHYNIPPSIEAFYQEAGRAGRNRKTAFCCILASNDDQKRTDKLLSEITNTEEIDEIVNRISFEDNDDITRQLYFHTQAFRGISKEKQDIEVILNILGDISQSAVKVLRIPNEIRDRIPDLAQARTITEKALHRLLLVGIVSDYTIDYNSNEFNIKVSGANREEIVKAYGKYIAGYHQGRSEREVEAVNSFINRPLREFIVGVVDRLLHFIYDVIERGRRRALREMLLACSISSRDEDIRLRILQYLEETEYLKLLDGLLSADGIGITEAKEIISYLCSPNEAAELRGQVARYLESYPDHPSLLILRSVSEALSRDKARDVVVPNFLAAMSSALTKYSVDEGSMFDFMSWTIPYVIRADKDLAKHLIKELFHAHANPQLAKALMNRLPVEFMDIPSWYLLSELLRDCISKIIKRS